MGEYNIDSLVRDPEFQGKPFSDRAAILRQADPEGFGKLNDKAQSRMLMDMKGQDWWQGGTGKTKTAAPKEEPNPFVEGFKEPFKVAGEAALGTIKGAAEGVIGLGYTLPATLGALAGGGSLDEALRAGTEAGSKARTPMPFQSKTSQFLGKNIIQPGVNKLSQLTGQPELVQGGVELGGDIAALYGLKPGVNLAKTLTQTAKAPVSRLANMRPGINPELAALSKEHNIPLTAGMASGKAGLKNVETQLERVPFVGTRGAMEAGSAKVSAAAQRLVDKFTPENPVDVPEQIQTGMLKTLNQGKADVGNIQKQISMALGKHPDMLKQVGQVKPTALGVEATKLLDQFPDIFDRLPSTPLKSKLTAIKEGSVAGKPDVQGIVPVTKTTGIAFDEAMRLREMLNNYISRAYKSAGAVGSKETYQLTALKRALDKDISTWGETSSNSEIVKLFKQRNQAYIDKVVPFKDAIVKTATGDTFDTDLLYSKFIKSNRPQLAQKLMNALDDEGRQLVKYSVLKKALEAGQETKPGVPFSPAKFAKEIESLGATKGIIFPGSEGHMVGGFAKLLRAAERYGQFAENPPTGLRATDTGISVGIGGGLVTHPFITGGALGVTKLLSTMLTTEWGKSILLKAAKTPANAPTMKMLLKQIAKETAKMAPAGVTKAATTPQPAAPAPPAPPSEGDLKEIE